MSSRRGFLWVLVLMASGGSRNFPMSVASTNTTRADLQKENPSEVRSPRDVLTILLIFAVAAALIALLAVLFYLVSHLVK